MDDQRIVISSSVTITPEAVRDREFATVFRGYQPSEVRQFLLRVSEELVEMAQREQHSLTEMREAVSRAAHPEMDESALTNALGDHTARLIAAARETAAGITADAEKAASSMLRDAEARVARMRQDAEAIVASRIEEADNVTANLRQAAQAEARAIREQAEAEAEAALHSARAQGKEMVGEAREVRERMLSDLSRRRRAAQVQLEQLRVARERLMTALDVVRRTLDEATEELAAAEPEARMAAEAVARDMASSAVVDDLVLHVKEHSARPAESETPPAREPRLSVAGERERSKAIPEGFVSPITTTVPSWSGSAPPSPSPASSRGPGRTEPGSVDATLERLMGAGSLGAAARAATSASPIAERPTVRPQSVVESALPPADPTHDAGVPGPPVATDELATGEVPAVGQHRTPVVEELFARIRADQGPEDGGEQAGDDPAEPTAAGGSAESAPAPESVDAPAPGDAADSAPDVASGGTGGDAAGDNGIRSEEFADQIDLVDEAALAQRDTLLDPLDSAIVRAMKRVLRDEQNEVLDRLRQLKGGSPAQALPSVEDQRATYRAPIAPLLAEAAKAAGGEVAQATAEAWADELSETLLVPLRERLDRAFEGHDDSTGDASEAEAAEAVRLAYRQCKVSEIDPLVRHHTAAAFSRGVHSSAPDGSSLRWVVDDDGPCPDCDDNALAGPTPKGEEYPTGQPYPPAHPGCRCLLVPAT